MPPPGPSEELPAMVLLRTSTDAVPLVGMTLRPPPRELVWLPLWMTLTSRSVRRPEPAAMPVLVWSTPSMVKLRNVTLRPSPTVTLGDRSVKPGVLRSTVLAPAPSRITLALTATCPANVPFPRVTVVPLAEQASAAATVWKGLIDEADAHAGSDVAVADTYRCW